MKGFVIFFLIGVIMSGCAGKNGNSRDLSNPDETQNSVAAPSQAPDVALKATAEGNLVFIHIKNNALDSLRISPHFFALIIDNKRPEIRYHPSIAQSEMPVTKISKGTEVSGRIRFSQRDNLVGQKLVFNSPDYEPIMTFIDKYISE
ncbi:hypothetical protein JW926_07865 [Candidatus Sumerlaeota bacterium]|nr:hypothetical protein [Candidatus Sumerlaeota bacterium]